MEIPQSKKSNSVSEIQKSQITDHLIEPEDYRLIKLQKITGN